MFISHLLLEVHEVLYSCIYVRRPQQWSHCSMKPQRPWHSQWELKGGNLCRAKLNGGGRNNSHSWKTREKIPGQKATQGKQWRLYGDSKFLKLERNGHPRRREYIRKWANRPVCAVQEGVSSTFKPISLRRHCQENDKVRKNGCWHWRMFWGLWGVMPCWIQEAILV